MSPVFSVVESEAFLLHSQVLLHPCFSKCTWFDEGATMNLDLRRRAVSLTALLGLTLTFRNRCMR